MNGEFAGEGAKELSRRFAKIRNSTRERGERDVKARYIIIMKNSAQIVDSVNVPRGNKVLR